MRKRRRYLFIGMSAVFLFSIRELTAVTYFAQFAIGAGYEATLMVTNPTANTWNGKARVRSGNDQRWPGSWTVNGQSFTDYDAVTFSVVPHGTNTLVFRGDSALRSGFVELEGTSGSSDNDVALAYFYRLFEGGQLISSTGSPRSQLINNSDPGLIIPVEESAAVRTGYAMAPWLLTSVTYPVVIMLVNQGGTVIDTKTITFTGHMAEFTSQRFPSMPIPFVGHLKISMPSSAPDLTGVAVEVLRMEITGQKEMYTSTPADWYSLLGKTDAYEPRDAAKAAVRHLRLPDREKCKELMDR